MITALIFLSFVVVLFIVSPWFAYGPEDDRTAEDTIKRLLEQKEKLLHAYRDLELDYKTDKMTESDYTEQKASLLQELDGVYKSLDADT